MDTIESLTRREGIALRAYRAAERGAQRDVRGEQRLADAQRRLWLIQLQLMEERDRRERESAF